MSSEKIMGVNITNNETLSHPYNLPYWYLSEGVLILLTIIAVYIFVCVSKYGLYHKFKNSRELQNNNRGKWLYGMCVMATFFTVIRLISDHVAAFLGWKSTDMCILTLNISSVMYALSLYPVYIFLWMRQSIFYANPVLSKILNKWITALSWSALILIIISGLALLVLYNIPEVTGWEFKVTPEGCTENGNTLDVVPIVATVITVIFQVFLLGLFMYPLISRKTQRYRSTSVKSNKGDAANSVANHQSSSEYSREFAESKVVKNSNCAAIPRADVDSSESGIDVSPPTGSGKDLDRMGIQVKIKSLNPSVNENQEINLNECKDAQNNAYSNRCFANRKIIHHRSQNDIETTDSNAELSVTSPDVCDSDNSRANKKDPVTKIGAEYKKSLRARKRQGRRVIGYIKKSFTLMLVCVGSDILINLLQEVVEVPELVYLVMFDINLIINDLCIIASFREWRYILLPLCVKSKH